MIDAYFMGRSRFSYGKFKTWMNNRYGTLSINRLVLSHLHHDHIKSAHRIVNDFDPQEVIFPSSLEHPTATIRNLLQLCGERGISRVLSNMEVTDYGDLRLTLKATVNFCDSNLLSSDPNEHGIAVLIETKRSFALLPGDIPGHLLYNLNNYYIGAANKYRFYKVTHHCNHTGHHPEFLAALNPKYAATSCSSSNSYGHPEMPPKNIIDNTTKSHGGTHSLTCCVTHPYLEYNIY